MDSKSLISSLKNAGILFSNNFTIAFVLIWYIFVMGYIIGITFFVPAAGSEKLISVILGFLLGTIVSTFVNFIFNKSLAEKIVDILGVDKNG